MRNALRDGVVADAIESVREDRIERTKTRRTVLVGTNHYPDTEETKADAVDTPPPQTSAERASSLDLSGATLDDLRTAVANGAPIADVVAALRAGASAVAPLPRVRLSTPFETLRLRAERASEEGTRPVVTLLPMGHPGWRSARATFSRNFFGVGGFAVRENLRFDTPEDAAQAVADDGAAIAVLCSSDAEYPDLAPQVRVALDDVGADALLVVAGNPEQIDGDVLADDFVHMGSPLHETLRAFQERLGIQ
jgi:methylmalonyl-CoA mutase